MNASFSRGVHTFEVKNTASGVTSCDVCHNIADHTWSSTSLHINKVTCWACHDQTFVVNASNFSVNINGTGKYDYGIYKDPTTNKWTTFIVNSSLKPASWKLHNISKNVSCNKCHEAYSPWNGTTRQDTPIAYNLSAGGKSCINCHDTGGFAGAGKLVEFSSAGDSYHKDLNSAASSPSGYASANFKCWACHGDGDGSEAAQPSGGGHPLNYRTPKNCNNEACHSISQSQYNEPMIYSHFQNSSKNGNPGNNTDYNITTSERCETCHINSLVTDDGNSNLALASHYGNKDDLIDSFNCIYCHNDKNNSEDWGNASLVNKNRTSLYEVNKEKNTLLGLVGETVDLGDGYSLKLKDISKLRGDALIELMRNGIVLDEFLLGIGNKYEYEQYITLDNDSVIKAPVITINITSVFTGELSSFIQFESTRIRKVHTGKEINNSACYACHLYRYSPEKQRFKIIDREYDDESEEDKIYYTKVLVDFNYENKSKIYFNDEDYVFSQLDSLGTSLPFSAKKKYLAEGEKWDLSDGYYIKLNEVTTDSYQAWIDLVINGVRADDQIVKVWNNIDYIPEINYKKNILTEVTVFTGFVPAVFQGKPNFILLQDVLALSPEIMNAAEDTTIFGYNTSWLYTNDTITVGKIPENLHSPNLFTDQRKWADCVACHDTSNNLRITSINAISSRLGKHSILNAGDSNITPISDDIDKACWGCHTEGVEPSAHPPLYITPRNCISCHKDQEMPTYGAKYIGDESHGDQSNCESCHASESHGITALDALPSVTDVVLSGNNVSKGENIDLSGKAVAGYRMKVKAAEYFIDKIGESGKGRSMLPADGAFDSQNEEIKATIDTNDLSEGEHTIYVHAMERNNKWGKFTLVNFSIGTGISAGKKERIPGPGIVYIMIVLLSTYLILYKHSRKN